MTDEIDEIDEADEADEADEPAGLHLVVAIGRGGAIGRAGELPWHAPEDLAHFRATTMGHHVILGSVTWASIGRALPGRELVVVSSRTFEVPTGVTLARDPAAALALASAHDRAPRLAGGTRLYEALLPHVVRLHRTDVDEDVPDADAFFPALDDADWVERSTRPGTDPRLTFRVLDRR